MKRRQRAAFFSLVMLLGLGLFLELMAYLSGEFILRSRGSFLLADTEISMSPNAVEYYFSNRDPVLGWSPTNLFETAHFDNRGARPSAEFPEPGPATISLYGGSFTYGSEVGHEDAWGNVLSRLLGYKVANYGVPGYGPDQAYLRFKSNVDDQAQTVILGLIGDHIIRILNQDRRFIGEQHLGLKLKPRFILSENNELVYVPIPPITRELVPDYLRHPETYLHHEYFLPGSADGGVIFESPFLFSIGKALSKKRATNFYLNKLSSSEFFTEGHESQALPLLVAILMAFDKLAAERDARLLVVMLPTARHLMYQSVNDTSPVRLLKDYLDQKNIHYVDLTDQILSELNDQEICQIFSRQHLLRGCGGHYNERGNKLVARLIKRLIYNKEPLTY